MFEDDSKQLLSKLDLDESLWVKSCCGIDLHSKVQILNHIIKSENEK